MASGYRSPLPQAVLLITAFWWFVAVVVFFLLPPWALTQWLDATGIQHPEITPLNQLAFSVSFLADIVLHTAAGWIVGILVAITIGFAVWALLQVTHKNRANPSQSWRGVQSTICVLPHPNNPTNKEAQLGLPKAVRKTLNKPQAALINQVLGYLHDSPSAFVGDGHKGTLLDHTLNVMETALELDSKNPLLLMTACCHDIGKTVAWQKDENNEWKRIGWHAQEGAKLLTRFTAWWQLPIIERRSIQYAIAYEHNINHLPARITGLDRIDYEAVLELMNQLRQIDGLATKEEKAEVLAEIEPVQAALDAFLSVLPELPFHEAKRRMAAGVNGAGWRIGERLYLLEKEVRDKAMKHLDKDVYAALGGAFRSRGQVAAYSEFLFQALAEKGWLVVEAQGGKSPGDSEPPTFTVSDDYPFYNIKTGKFSFTGVFAVELPKEYKRLYPSGESPFNVMITGKTKRQGSVSQAPSSKQKHKSKPWLNKKKQSKKETDATSEADEMAAALEDAGIVEPDAETAPTPNGLTETEQVSEEENKEGGGANEDLVEEEPKKVVLATKDDKESEQKEAESLKAMMRALEASKKMIGGDDGDDDEEPTL